MFSSCACQLQLLEARKSVPSSLDSFKLFFASAHWKQVTNPLIFVLVVVFVVVFCCVADVCIVPVTVVFIRSFIQASSSSHRLTSVKIQLFHVESSLALRSVRPRLIIIIFIIIIKSVCYIHNI